MSGLTKSEITAWVNATLATAYDDIKDVPAKAAAKLLQALHGQRFPIERVQFDDALKPTRLHNCEVVLNTARAFGCTATLTPEAWVDAENFAQLLIFWRWLRQAAAAHGPFAAGFDFSLVDHGVVEPHTAPGPDLPQPAADAGPVPIPDAPAPTAVVVPTPTSCGKCGSAVERLTAPHVKRLVEMRKVMADLEKAIYDNNADKIVDVLEAAAAV